VTTSADVRMMELVPILPHTSSLHDACTGTVAVPRVWHSCVLYGMFVLQDYKALVNKRFIESRAPFCVTPKKIITSRLETR
jgi:hypothetical protein